MTFREYEAMVEEMFKTTFPDPDITRAYAALGLAGETGEVIEILKKGLRNDEHRVPVDEAELALELGDVLMYTTRNGSLHRLTLEDIAVISDAKQRRRRFHGKDHAGELEMARAILAVRRWRRGETR